MEITSVYFGLSVILSVFIYYFIHHKYRIVFLTLLSCCFIATYSFNLLFYVIIFSLINYCIGLRIPVSRFRKALFRAGIIINLLQLVLLKYVSFTSNPILQLLNVDLNLSRLSQIIIPVGISFFTLQGIGYLINIQMTWEKPEKNYLHFFLYIIFYPKFLSGPIERSNHFLPQLKINHLFKVNNTIEGLRIVLIGVFKKVVIANQLAPFINGTYANLDSGYGLPFWIIVLLQPLYLYFDFSGYTDIAIGIAKIYGIELLPNFNRPFLSTNMTNFWKRFHISLSSWFNDYVFRQTSFKYRRWGIYGSIFAVFVTWVLFGIWHGAGWNFMMLGCVQAVAIIYEFLTKKWRVRLFSKIPGYFSIWLARIFTFLFYGGSLVFFFSPNLKTAFKFFGKLKYFNISSNLKIEDKRILLFTLGIIAILLILEVLFNDKQDTYIKIQHIWNRDDKKFRILRYLIYYILILFIFYFGKIQTEFIYFQF